MSTTNEGDWDDGLGDADNVRFDSTGRMRPKKRQRTQRRNLPAVNAIQPKPPAIVEEPIVEDLTLGGPRQRETQANAVAGPSEERRAGVPGAPGPAGAGGGIQQEPYEGAGVFDEDYEPPIWGTRPEDEVAGFMYDVPGGKVRGPSGPEHVMEFVPQVENWVDLLVVRQARPKDELCQRCKGRDRGPADWRCVCCFKRRDVCISCLRRDHIDLPFHRVYWWNGRNYRRSWLREAGVAIYLCPHTRHETPCPQNRRKFQEHIPARVPAGLADRRGRKGKAPARPAAPAAVSASPETPLAELPELTSVPRAPASSNAMRIDEDSGQVERYVEDDAPIPEVPPELEDIDSQLSVLYARLEALDKPQVWEVEEEPGGTDDVVRPSDEDVEGLNPDAGAAGGPSGGPGAPGDPPPRARGAAAIPDYDLHGFPTLVLVHDNGVHGLGVNFCKCDGHLPEYEQLLLNGLFPASTRSPATAYDVESLEKAAIETAECRTTTEQYWKKTCRLTHPDDPTATVDRYAITTRVHREYRAVRQYLGFGFAHQDPENRRAPGEGEMAHRCVACPHESNRPADFDNLPQAEQDLYFNAWAIDGNMKAEHTTSRRPQNNVQIFPGTAFFPDPEDYAEKAKKPFTDKSLPPSDTRGKELCHQHTAAGAVSVKSDPSKDIRGILSICCARHGCMCPGATVDIPLAENQFQADYALNRSMRINLSANFSRRLLLGYDIWCQYGVHLLKRFQKAEHLKWPAFLEELTGIVGAWHIFAHVRECFARFSGLYVWGIGLIEMEILETLWSLLNMVTESTRNMSRANREETINFHMNEINLRKNQIVVASTVRKWTKQTKVRATRMRLLDIMSEACPISSRMRWQAELTEVYRKRSIDLKEPSIYDPKFMDKFLESEFKAPDRRDVETKLLARETAESDEQGLVKFIMNGLQLQIEQLTWQAFEKTHTMNATNKRQLASARSSLKSRIAKHNQRAIELLGPRPECADEPGDDMLFGAQARVRLVGISSRTEWETGSSRAAREPSTRQPEFYGVDLPSSRPMPLSSAVAARAGAYEITLRTAWLEEILHEICLGLVAQVEIFRRTIKRTPGRGGLTQREKNHTGAATKEQYQSVRLYAQEYNVFLEKMTLITAADAVSGHPEYTVAAGQSRLKFKPLSANDIKADLTAYDALSSGEFKLPWFWKLSARNKNISDEGFIQDFFRVRWINARCGVDRCDEELAVLRVEMGSIYRGFGSLARVWEQRAELMERIGDREAHAAHAWEKAEIWSEFADHARNQFNAVVPHVIR